MEEALDLSSDRLLNNNNNVSSHYGDCRPSESSHAAALFCCLERLDRKGDSDSVDGRLHGDIRQCESRQLLATYSTSLADHSPATLSTVLKGPLTCPCLCRECCGVVRIVSHRFRNLVS